MTVHAERTAASVESPSPDRRRLVVRPLGVVVTLAILVCLPLVLPGWTSFLVVVGIYYLAVLGLDVFLGQTGQVSLGQTLFFAIGAYGAGVLSLRHGIPTLLALVLMAVLSGLVAYVVGRPFLRLRGYYLALATLGVAVITESIATGWGSFTGGPSGLVGIPNLTIGSYTFVSDRANYYAVLVAGVLAATFVAGLRRSTCGRALTAIAEDQNAAAMLGIDPASFKARAFVLAAVLASVSGSLFGFYERFVSPDSINVLFAFTLVIMLAVGGRRSLLGPLVGVLILQALPEAGQGFAKYEPLVAGVVLILVITYLPDGVWGSARQFVEHYVGKLARTLRRTQP